MRIRKLFPIALAIHDEGATPAADKGEQEISESAEQEAEDEITEESEAEESPPTDEDTAAAEGLRMQEQVTGWLMQAEQMQEIYPGFDLKRELDSGPEFLNLLKSGAGVEAAYWAVNFRELGAGIASAAGRRAEENLRSNLEAKGRRPVEAGAAVQPAVIVRGDPSRFTKSELRAAVEKARHGEKIKF